MTKKDLSPEQAAVVREAFHPEVARVANNTTKHTCSGTDSRPHVPLGLQLVETTGPDGQLYSGRCPYCGVTYVSVKTG